MTFDLASFSPAEVEKMTGLSTAMQRDWRARGYLPKSKSHARFDMFAVAEIWVMKMFSDMGKGPSATFAHAPKIALAVIASALEWRTDAWAGSPVEAFAKIPRDARSQTRNETSWQQMLEAARAKPRDIYYRPGDVGELDARVKRGEIDPHYMTEWMAIQLYRALQIRDFATGYLGEAYLPHTTSQVVWWPTGEVSLDGYNSENFHSTGADEPFDRVDPRFDGPALVLDISAAAANLVRRAPRPLVGVEVEVNEAAQIETVPLERRYDQGVVYYNIGSGR